MPEVETVGFLIRFAVGLIAFTLLVLAFDPPTRDDVEDLIRRRKREGR